MRKQIALLGSTGSIGKQTTEVVSHFPDRFQIVSIAASGNNLPLIEEQIYTFKPKIVAIEDERAAARLRASVDNKHTKIISGQQGVIEAATMEDVNMVVAAISGFAGLRSTLAAIEAGKDIALANKETLVTAGSLIMKKVTEKGINLIPVDSEHSAIFQCLFPLQKEVVNTIILTASGGPFRGLCREKLQSVSPIEALKHPNWSMGKKITIDSATLVNKGLEVIEAHHLFSIPYEKIEVVIHPQSIIHSMVRYQDGSIIAHLGNPDMRIPIQYALSYPDRLPNTLENLDFAAINALTFEKPDNDTFKGLSLAFQAGRASGIKPTVYNAANEIAVDLFLQEKIRFLDIPELIEAALENIEQVSTPGMDDIFSADTAARQFVLDHYSKELTVK